MQKITIPDTIQGLIFDFDGTLADTMPIQWEAWHEALEIFQVDVPQEFLDRHKGVPTEQIVAEINQTFGFQLDATAVVHEKEQRVMAKLEQVKPIEPVLAVAREYYGRLPLAIASGGEQETVLKALKIMALTDLFDPILTAGDDVPPKPAPDIFLEAARRMQVPPQHCLVLEDGDPGIVAAQKAQMAVIDVWPLLDGQG